MSWVNQINYPRIPEVYCKSVQSIAGLIKSRFSSDSEANSKLINYELQFDFLFDSLKFERPTKRGEEVELEFAQRLFALVITPGNEKLFKRL